jgi:hypothetical protein
MSINVRPKANHTASPAEPSAHRDRRVTSQGDAGAIERDETEEATGRRKLGRLRKTFVLTMGPDEALTALRKLDLGRFSLEFVTIPAAGGCVVAVYSLPAAPQPALLGRFFEARLERNVMSLLANIESMATG